MPRRPELSGEPVARDSSITLIVNLANGGRLAPDDIALIDAIRRERSILGASRATGVSYRKCWLMVDALNRTFESAVFVTHPGRRGGGAELTAFGERLVALYRSIERRSRSASQAALGELTAALDPGFAAQDGAAVREGPPPQPAPFRSRRP